MKTVAIHLQKGGVGKTTIAGSLAFELSRRGRVVMLDCDPQGNLSSWYLRDAPRHELADVLFGRVEAVAAVAPTPWPNLDIVPTFGLDGDLKLYAENQVANEPFIVCDLVDLLAAQGYDFCIMDLSPGMGRLERAVLIASTEVITPMLPDSFSLDGLSIFDAELKKTAKALRRGPVHSKIVLDALDERITLHKRIRDEAEKLQGFTLYKIPTDPGFRKAQIEHLPVQELPRDKQAKPETLAEITRMGEDVCH